MSDIIRLLNYQLNLVQDIHNIVFVDNDFMKMNDELLKVISFRIKLIEYIKKLFKFNLCSM